MTVQVVARRTTYCRPGGLFVNQICAYSNLPFSNFNNIAQSCSASDGYSTPNPILPITGEKYRWETDLSHSGIDYLNFSRGYLSGYSDRTLNIGGNWWHNHHYQLIYLPYQAAINVRWPDIPPERYEAARPETVIVNLGNGETKTFQKNRLTNQWKAIWGVDSLEKINNQFVYKNHQSDDLYYFDENNLLIEIVTKAGSKTKYFYENKLLKTVVNSFNKSLSFTYNVKKLISSVKSTDGKYVNYEYDSLNRLIKVIYPDNSFREYQYDSSVNFNFLTGIKINGKNYQKYTYNNQGYAIKSELDNGIESYQVSYDDFGKSSTITDPLGTKRKYSYRMGIIKNNVYSESLPSATKDRSIAATTSNRYGLPESERDFNNQYSYYQWDSNRFLLLSENKGGLLQTQYEWHPQWRVPTKITEPQRITKIEYNKQALPIKQTIENRPTDGSAVKQWITQWTYNDLGLPLSETDSNGVVTRFVYDQSGNLIQRINALGHTDSYTYDAAGRVLTHTAPNGVLSSYSWDVRGRLLSQNSAGLLTQFSYNLDGTLSNVRLPSLLKINYVYDSAMRLTGWNDNRGNQANFTLDNMGNRTQEKIQDVSGKIAWQVQRTINSLNRIEKESTQLSDNEVQTTTIGYDANARPNRITNNKGEVTGRYLDNLGRTVVIDSPLNTRATFTYDLQGNLSSASDEKYQTTNYSYDALGNKTSEKSPDVGTQSIQYDALGLPQTLINALGQNTQIQRDVLGRPTSLRFADGQTTTLRYDLNSAEYSTKANSTPNSNLGLLVEWTDSSGTTKLMRDEFGRIVRKTQILKNGTSEQISYSYNSNGQIASMTYPSNRVVSYQFNATGQISALLWNGQTIISDIKWNALGQPLNWTSKLSGKNGVIQFLTQREYDQAGRLIQAKYAGNQAFSYRFDKLGRVEAINQNLWVSDNVYSLNTFNVNYDKAGRIILFEQFSNQNKSIDKMDLTYDTNGNRTKLINATPSYVINKNYSINGNRSVNLAFNFKYNNENFSSNQTFNYQHNAAGDILKDESFKYTYDAQSRLNTSTSNANPPYTNVYLHNLLGQRVFKSVDLYNDIPANPKGTSFIYDENGTLLSEKSSQVLNNIGITEHIWLPTANGTMPIFAVIDNQQYAVIADHLNTPRQLIQSDGQTAWQWSYSAFGDNKALSKNNVNYNLRYPGQYYDRETGLHYNYFRTYDPKTGRYTQGDPIGLAGGFNRFGYVNQDGINYADPLGLKLVDFNPSHGNNKKHSKQAIIANAYKLLSCNNRAGNWFRESLQKKNLTLEDLFFGDKIEFKYGFYERSWFDDTFIINGGLTRWDGIFQNNQIWKNQPNQSMGAQARKLNGNLDDATKLFIHELSHLIEAYVYEQKLPIPKGSIGNDHGDYLSRDCECK